MPNDTEKVLKEATLVFMVRDQEVLLGLKTESIGAGCRNGYGGGIEGEETPDECALREVKEESGVIIDPKSLVKVAEATFHNTKSDGTIFSCLVHVYIATAWKGEPRASKEMADPKWYRFDALPMHEFMPADPLWLPFIFDDKKIRVDAHYGPKQKTLTGPVIITDVLGFD